MITIEQQQTLFTSIARRLKQKVTAYAIGGTAMMFMGFEEATLDIDLVFENEKDRTIFKDAISSLGYQEMDAVKVYGVKRNAPQMLKLDDERFDLFVQKVVFFIFSEDMRKRADQTHQFGDKLIIRVANPHDIILMKCATDRVKDKDDVTRIIKAMKLNWDILVSEAKKQIELGEQRAALELGGFLEDLKKTDVDIPKKVLDQLYKIVENQAKEKQK